MATIFPLSASVGQEFEGYIYDGTIWNLIGNEYNPTVYSAYEPDNPKPGDLWVDSSVDVATFALDDYLTIASASSTYATKSELDNIDLSSASAAAVAAIVDSAPSTLNTLNELAQALNDDANFAGTVTNSLSNKLDISTASATYATQSYVDQELANIDLSEYLTNSNASSTYVAINNMSATPVSLMLVGGSAQRPSPASDGMFRFNTDTNNPEWYSSDNNSWIPFSDPAQYMLEIMIVAGGGGAGGSSADGVAGGGGAGAGGYLFFTNQQAQPGTQYAVTVGGGGAGGSKGNVGAQGGNSSVTGLTTAVGGGAGRDADDSNVAVSNGGSGGGASGSAGGGAGSGTAGQGYDGGSKNDGNAGSFAGGGGGGIGGPGSGRTPGGGTTNSISGTIATYAEGGYGQGTSNFINAAQSRSANTGSGGHGAFNGTSTGGNGGSGIVVIRYQSPIQRGSGGVVSTSSGYYIHTFTTSGVFTA